MRTPISIILITLLIAACAGPDQNEPEPVDERNEIVKIIPDYKSKKYEYKFDGSSYVTKYIEIRIEGCQYFDFAGTTGFFHKGNCDNPIHKCKCQHESSN